MTSGLEPPNPLRASHDNVPMGERQGDLSPVLCCSFSPTLCLLRVFNNSAVSSELIFSKYIVAPTI